MSPAARQQQQEEGEGEGEGEESTAEAMSVLRELSSVSCLAASPRRLYSGSLEGNDILCRAIEDTSASSLQSQEEDECVRVSEHSDSIL